MQAPACEDWLSGTRPYPDGKCLFPHRVNVSSDAHNFDELVVDDSYQELNDELVADS